MSNEVLILEQQNQTIDVTIHEQNITFEANEQNIEVTMLERGPKGEDGEVTLDGVQTLTNKRIVPRINSIITNTSTTPSGDISDMYLITGLDSDISILAPSGTPVDGQRLTIKIKSDGNIHNISRNAIYREFATLPVVTIPNKTIYVGMFYNLADTKRDIVSVAQEK